MEIFVIFCDNEPYCPLKSTLKKKQDQNSTDYSVVFEKKIF